MMVHMIFLFHTLLRTDRIVFAIFWMYEGVLSENGMITTPPLLNTNPSKLCNNKRACVMCSCKYVTIRLMLKLNMYKHLPEHVCTTGYLYSFFLAVFNTL